jgi:hypothetical protein
LSISYSMKGMTMKKLNVRQMVDRVDFSRPNTKQNSISLIKSESKAADRKEELAIIDEHISTANQTEEIS